MRRVHKMVLTALMVSAAFVIAVLMKLMPLMAMPNGGSISLAMLPIFIVGFMLGPKYGFMAGIAYGLLNFLSDGYAFHWASLIFDYLVAFGCLGVSGFFARYALRGYKPINYIYFALGMIIPSILRFASHTISGVIAYDTAWMASMAYNGPYVFASMLCCLVVGFLIYPFLMNYMQEEKII